MIHLEVSYDERDPLASVYLNLLIDLKNWVREAMRCAEDLDPEVSLRMPKLELTSGPEPFTVIICAQYFDSRYANIRERRKAIVKKISSKNKKIHGEVSILLFHGSIGKF